MAGQNDNDAAAVAIVGMGCRFGGAQDLQAYWDLTRSGRDAFGPVPADRWDFDAFYDESPRAIDKSYAPTGAFVDDIQTFPAVALQVPPRRVEVMDPQQRLALELSLQASEDAGYKRGELPSRTGVYMGTTSMEWRTILSARVAAQMMAAGAWGTPPEDPEVLAKAVERVKPSRPFSAPGSLSNMIAATVAQELRLKGPAYTLDAACASALVALADAVAALRAGTIDAALAGGVYLTMSPEHHIGFSRVGAISRSGVCRPFDARADGFVEGEGGGVVVLKRLADARRDGDRVYGVIRGLGINNDGGGPGPMAPVLEGQVDVIRQAWADAGVDAEMLGYVESHGTGTSVGDQCEFQGLVEALGDHGERSVAIGSSKANVGHTMSAAGIAGLIRATLAVHHRTIPPMAGFDSAKPELGLDGSGFHVPVQAEAWDADHRIAGCSSFGFGGTNVHVVVEDAGHPAEEEPQVELLLMSGHDEASLFDLAARTADALRADADATVAGTVRSWAMRPRQDVRLGVVAATKAELIEKLTAVGRGELPQHTSLGTALESPRVAFMYPGQGAQRVGMLAGIRDRFEVVRDALTAADEAGANVMALPVTHLLYPERRTTAVAADAAMAQLTDTENCQPVLLAVGVALTQLLDAAGVTPDVVLGHSVGEFTAAVAGGVLSAADGVRWAAVRGSAMAGIEGDRGSMVALVADVATAERLLVDGSVIANVNHPRQVVVAGRSDAVATVTAAAEACDIQAVPLSVSHGFHSPVLAGLDLAGVVDAIELSEPTLPVASCIQDHVYASAAEARQVFKDHATSPVMFTTALQNAREAGANIFVQVGAGGPTRSFARGTLKGDDVHILALASKDDDDGGASLLHGLAELWVRGVDVDPTAFAAPAQLASVPPVVWPRQRYWAIADKPVRRARIVGRRAEGAAETETPGGEVEPTAAAPPAGSDIAEIVMTAVARTSAYPRAALKPEMSLQDDLGFDSMMIADLVEDLVKAVDDMDGVPQELLISSPTIGDLIAFAENPTPVGGDAQDDDAPVLGFAPIWRSAPLPTWDRVDTTAGQQAVVAGAGGALADAVQERLRAAGYTIVAASEQAPDLMVWVCEPGQPMPVSAVLAGEGAAPDPAGAFIAQLDAWPEPAKPPTVIVLRRDDDPWADAVAGALRSLSKDWTDSGCRSLRYDASLDAEGVAAALLSELETPSDTTVDVRWSSAGRQALGLEPAASAGEPWTPTAHDTVLITGGTRGIGLKLASRLVGTGARLLLAGRGAPSELAQSLIAESKGRVEAIQADVTDAAALSKALRGRGPVTALVHSAGVLADGPLGTVSPERGALARAVKVEGFLTSVQTCGADLKVALGIGSWAGRFGSRHQLHYAAGNALLASIASHLPSRIRGVVPEFGPWASSDMVATIPAAVQSAMRAGGVDFVGDEPGLDALVADLESGVGAVVHGRRLPTTTRVISARETLATETHPYLLDHAIEGTAVLPLAGAARHLADASGLAAPFEVRDLTLFAGVKVTQPVEIVATIDGDKAELRQGGENLLSYRATVRTLDADTVEVPAPAAGGEPVSESELRSFYDDVTFHGPLLQGIASIEGVGDGFVRGTLRTGSPRQWEPESPRDTWAIDPLVLDSAMQLSAFVAWHRFGRAGTPVGIGRYAQLAPLPEGTVTADILFGESEADRFSATIVLRDATGAALVVAEDVVAQLREVGDAAAATDDGMDDFEVKAEWTDVTQWPGYKDLDLRLRGAEMMGLKNPYFDMHEGTARNTTRIAGREVINYSSYNYLGLSGDARIRADVNVAMEKYGTSVSASRVASGQRPFHVELEQLLARSTGVEDALIFPSGHATNVTTIGHLMGPNDLVMHDELIHDSCIQGIKLSGAARRGFKHDDAEDLRDQLRQLRRHYEKVLIVVEGVYSMDGDICDMPSFCDVKEQYGCLLMVDEAHSFGTVGATGCGVREHFDLDASRVDIWMGTMSKSLAAMGGWIAGRHALIQYLRYTTPGFVFAAGMSPTLGQTALSALKLMLEEPWRVAQLQERGKFFYEALKARGVDTGLAVGDSPVVPAITGDSMQALMLSQRLLEDKGINAKPIVFPAVANDAARLRLFMTSLHTEEQLSYTADAIADTLAEIREEIAAGNKKRRRG